MCSSTKCDGTVNFLRSYGLNATNKQVYFCIKYYVKEQKVANMQ